MTEYSDIEQINALISEQQNIGRALTILDDYDGTITSVVVAPTTGSGAVAPTGVTMIDPPQAMISGVRNGLMQRYNDINRELEALGVENVPPNYSPGSPQIDPSQETTV